MMRILVILCLVLWEVVAFGEEKAIENEDAKKKKENEEWIGVMGGLSQFYLKDELGSYLRFEGQTRSIALTGLTEKLKSYHWGVGAFGIGKLHTSYASVDLMYMQIEFFYGRYLASYFDKKMKVSIMGGGTMEIYSKKYAYPRLSEHSEGVSDMILSLNFAVAGDYRLNVKHHLKAYMGSNVASYNNIYHVPGTSLLLSKYRFALWNRFLHVNMGVQYENRLLSSMRLYVLYRMDFQRLQRRDRTSSTFTHNLLIGFAYKYKGQ